nr:Putative transcription elongation factor SPT5 homolog 1 [Ipomoea batatas]
MWSRFLRDLARENKGQWNTYTEELCLFTTVITLSMLALYVPKCNLVFWLVDQGQMVIEKLIPSHQGLGTLEPHLVFHNLQ